LCSYQLNSLLVIYRILILQGNGGVRKSFIAALLAYSIGR